MALPLLEVEDLHATVHGGAVLRGLDLRVAPGELHAVTVPGGVTTGAWRAGVGPAGAASVVAAAIAGHPAVRVTAGRIRFHGEDVTAWPAERRAKAGMFVAFGLPEELPGVPVAGLLHQALAARRGRPVPVVEARAAVEAWGARLGVAPGVAGSGPEGTGVSAALDQELLQLAVLEPDLALLDGIGPGLDPDGLASVAGALARIRAARPGLAALVTTADRRVLGPLRPDVVHWVIDGRLSGTGGPELALHAEGEGYEAWRST